MSIRAKVSEASLLNAANEIAVAAFLQEQITFTQIPHVVEHTLNQIASTQADCLETILAADQQARLIALDYIETGS